MLIANFAFSASLLYGNSKSLQMITIPIPLIAGEGKVL
jgi:hypothetical protein